MFHRLKWLYRLLLAGWMLCVLFMPGISAMAEETIQVHIPAIASGTSCAAALYDSQGHRIQLLPLEKDIGNAFLIECNGLLQTRYTATVYDTDTEDIRYDRSMYTIYVNVYYGPEEKLQSSVTIERQTPEDDSPSSKEGMIRFNNQSTLLPATHTPSPSPTPTPGSTATPLPYNDRFTFRKLWSGDHEDSIDWVMYNGDGTARSKLFNKTVISETEWFYEAYFQHDVSDCYIIEYVPEGYTVSYVNVGPYADVTDRCYSGGTIINRKAPQTGDPLPIGLHLICILAAGAGLVLLARSARKKYV